MHEFHIKTNVATSKHMQIRFCINPLPPKKTNTIPKEMQHDKEMKMY